MTARRWQGPAGAVALAPLACGLVATWVVLGRAFAHRSGSMPVADLEDGLQRACWLPWQLADNVRGGRGLLDASVFVPGHAENLLDYAGNPGAGWLGAFVQFAVSDPVAGHDAWILGMVLTNAVAMASLGRALAGGRVRGALLGAAMGAGCAVWNHAVGAGAVAAGWIAPAAWLLRGWVAGRTVQVVVAGMLGAIVAPVSVLVAGALVAGGVVRREAPGVSRARGLALALASACALGARLSWPPLGAGLAAPDMALAQWAGPFAPTLGDGRIGLPVLAGAGLVALVHAGGRRRLLGVCALFGALVLLGPWILGADGAPATLAGGRGIGGLGAAARWWVNEGACGLVLVGLVSLLGAGVRGQLVCLALAAWSLAEPTLLVHRGQPAQLWPGVPWPVPASLRALADTPRAHVVAALPLFEARDGAVGFVPFHRQRVVAPPGVHQEVATRLAFQRVVNEDAALRALASLGRDQLSATLPSPAAGLLAHGIDRVVLLGGDPALRAAATRALGPATDDLWVVEPDAAPSLRGQDTDPEAAPGEALRRGAGPPPPHEPARDSSSRPPVASPVPFVPPVPGASP